MTRLLLTAVALLFAYPALSSPRPVPCDSISGYRECRVGTSGTILLVAERSDDLCREGISWGTASDGVVWVDRGCRGLFRARSSIGGRVVCESLDGERKVCTADTTTGVSLARQLSKAACFEGETWGYQDGRDEIWVDQGCRGEFLLAPAAPRSRTPNTLHSAVVCESRNGRRAECVANTIDGVQIIRHLSDSECRFGTHWGYDAKKIWVTGGCRAEFAVRGDAKAMATSLECESRNLRRNCEGDTRLGVALMRQLSEKKCILDETWGFDDQAVWVTDGCHGQFALGGFRLPEDAIPATATRITCESVDGTPTRCPIDASRGAGLVRQISDTDCVLNRTWGYDREGIWVSGGCRAEFAVAR
ncbi:MAG TPA: DUF3011 domain-containing protein [Thermoanaerobaculia bacterium]